MEEIWKDVVGYEGLYQVSNLGRIKSFVKHTGNGNILKNFKNTDGYDLVIITNGIKRSTKTVHRLMAIAFIPNPENKPQVNHIDANKKNNNLSNLEWVTRSENTLHAYKVGVMGGRKMVEKRFIPISVKNIETEEVLNFESITNLSKHFKVEKGNMTNIMNRKRCVAKFSKYEFTRL